MYQDATEGTWPPDQEEIQLLSAGDGEDRDQEQRKVDLDSE